jgi:hypothetical protein
LVVGVIGLGLAYARESAYAKRLASANNRADRRLDQAMQAIRGYFEGVSEEVVLGRPEFRDLRKRLLERPISFYEDLAKELDESERDDPRARTLLGYGRNGLGRIFQALGRMPEAKTQFELARDIFNGLIETTPSWPAYHDEHANRSICSGVTRFRVTAQPSND